MRFQEKYAYPAPFDTVWKMYQDPKFTEDRLKEGQLENVQIQVSGDDNTLSAVAAGTVSPEMIPDQVRRFVKGNLGLEVIEKWTRTSPTSATGTMSVNISGAPVRIAASCTLTQAADAQTVRTMDGEIKVSIPLLGARLEKEALRFIPQLIDGEIKAANTWLSSN